MIDLHTHTKYSDGTWSVKELLENAQKTGITVLSITDHNTVNAYKELDNNDYTNLFSGKIITGAEFEVIFDNSKIEILGYNFDYSKVDKWINDEYNKEKKNENLYEEFELLVNACKKNNIIIDDIKYDVTMGWPIDNILPLIKAHEENRKKFTEKQWNNKEHFFRCCCSDKQFPLYIDFKDFAPDAKSISNKIRQSGGKVFVAHLFKYALNNYIEYLDKLRKNNVIDGVEVYHCSFNEEQIKILEDYCKRYNLYMSGGSDCHGMKRPDRKIGIGHGNLNISEELIKDWANIE